MATTTWLMMKQTIGHGPCADCCWAQWSSSVVGYVQLLINSYMMSWMHLGKGMIALSRLSLAVVVWAGWCHLDSVTDRTTLPYHRTLRNGGIQPATTALQSMLVYQPSVSKAVQEGSNDNSLEAFQRYNWKDFWYVVMELGIWGGLSIFMIQVTCHQPCLKLLVVGPFPPPDYAVDVSNPVD